LSIAKLSFNTAFNSYDFASNSELKFISANHQEEGKLILKKSNSSILQVFFLSLKQKKVLLVAFLPL
jgi:hypothetical protein